MACRRRAASVARLKPSVMLLNRARVIAIAVVAAGHAVLSTALWIWMAGVTGLGFKDHANWSAFDHAQASVVPLLALTITLPGRLLLPAVESGLALLALLLVNSIAWAVVLVIGYHLLRFRREQHNS